MKLDNDKKIIHKNIDLSSFSWKNILDFDLTVYTHGYHIKIKN